MQNIRMDVKYSSENIHFFPTSDMWVVEIVEILPEGAVGAPMQCT